MISCLPGVARCPVCAGGGGSSESVTGEEGAGEAGSPRRRSRASETPGAGAAGRVPGRLLVFGKGLTPTPPHPRKWA